MPSPIPTHLPTAADTARRLVDQSARDARDSLGDSQSAANPALDRVSSEVGDAHGAASQSLQRALDRTEQFGHHTLDAVRDGSQQLRRKAEGVTDASADYIRHEPIKSVLMAAAAGVALAALGSFFTRARRAGR